MFWIHSVSLFIACSLSIYLAIALLYPEKLS